jgi:hypothetical protein
MMPVAQPLPTVVLYGRRRVVTECARCGKVRPLLERGLCNPCRKTCHDDGTIGDYGYVKADRMADYACRRLNGDSIAAAAVRLGISKRTAERYEAQLRDAGKAPWRQWEAGLRAA